MAEVGSAETAIFVTVGAVARRLLDASGAVRDHPRRHGREQARHLHLDAARSGARHYWTIYRRTRTDLMALVGADAVEQAGAAHRLYVVFWTAQAGCGWPLLAILQVAQRLQGELRAYDRELDRYLLLTLPTGVDDRSVPALGRSYATLLALEAARFGVEVVSGQVLSAPVAECTVVIGQQGVPLPLDAQLRQAGAVLRLLADAGPLGTRVRAHLEQQRRSAASTETRGFTSIGVGSLEIDRDHVADHLAGLLLDASDQAERGRLEEARWR